MILSLALAALLGTALAEKSPEECADDCTVAWHQCKQAPLIDLEYCASDYCGCLGYNPFKSGYVVPLACKGKRPSSSSSETVSGSASAPASVATKSARDALQQKCLSRFRVCGARQDISNTDSPCAAAYSDCLQQTTTYGTIEATRTSSCASQSSASQPSATQSLSFCADRCVNEYHDCKMIANYVHCPSLIVQCLGYNPFYNGRLNVQGIACANETVSAPTATPVIKDKCASKCMNQYNACITYADGNRKAFCGMQMIQCVGYDPFQSNGLQVPTACKPTSTPVQTPQPTQDPCAKMCIDEWNACRAQPGASKSLCGSRFGKCLGYAPFLNSANSTLPASCVKPVIPANVTTKAIVPPFKNVTTLPALTTITPFKNVTSLPPFTNFTTSESTMPAVTEFPESTPSASLQTPFGTVWVPTPTKSMPAVFTAAAHHLEPVLPLVIFAAAAAVVIL